MMDNNGYKRKRVDSTMSEQSQRESEHDENLQVPLLLPVNNESAFISDPNSLTDELRALISLTIPVALSTVARLLIFSTDAAFIGHLKEKTTAMITASVFASSWNGFLSNFVFSPGYALNSLCSQAIGSGNLKLAGIWLQLAFWATAILCIPILLGYFATEPIVRLVVDDQGREDNIPELARDYNYMSMLVLWPMLNYMIIRQYFQAMQIAKPAMVVSFVTIGFNYLMNYIFVPEDGLVGWKLVGSPFATFVSMLFQLGSFITYTVFIKGYHKPYWGGWTWACFEKSRRIRFLNMVIPMALASILENSGFQLISFCTGHIGEENISALQILYNVWGMMWAFYWGVGLALQVRVGTKLGEGKVEGAKRVARISVGLVFAICTLTAIFTYMFRYDIARVYTDNETVIQIAGDSVWALLCDYYFSCMQLCACNLLEAMVQNKILAFTLSIGTWGISVPCSILFAYKMPYLKDYPVLGIFVGQAVGELFKAIFLWLYLIRLDWYEMSRQAMVRSETREDADDSGLEPVSSPRFSSTPTIPVQIRARTMSETTVVIVPYEVSALSSSMPPESLNLRRPSR